MTYWYAASSLHISFAISFAGDTVAVLCDHRRFLPSVCIYWNVIASSLNIKSIVVMPSRAGSSASSLRSIIHVQCLAYGNAKLHSCATSVDWLSWTNALCKFREQARQCFCYIWAFIITLSFDNTFISYLCTFIMQLASDTDHPQHYFHDVCIRLALTPCCCLSGTFMQSRPFGSHISFIRFRWLSLAANHCVIHHRRLP